MIEHGSGLAQLQSADATSQLSPELCCRVRRAGRSLVAARNWTLYPPEHPAVGSSVERLCDGDPGVVARRRAFAIGITPDTLLIEGVAADASRSRDRRSRGAAPRSRSAPPHLSRRGPARGGDAAAAPAQPGRRPNAARRGGPVQIWAADGHPSIALEQLDYEQLFARDGRRASPSRRKRDDLWRSIVMTISGSQKAVFDDAPQQRLLAIAGSAATSASSPRVSPRRSAPWTARR